MARSSTPSCWRRAGKCVPGDQRLSEADGSLNPAPTTLCDHLKSPDGKGCCACHCNSTKLSRTWKYGARAALTFRSSSALPVQPVPASTGVVAFLHRGDRALRALAQSRSSAHRSTPSRTPSAPAMQFLGSWRKRPKELGRRAQANTAAPTSVNFTNVPLSCSHSHPLAMARLRPALYSAGLPLS